METSPSGPQSRSSSWKREDGEAGGGEEGGGSMRQSFPVIPLGSPVVASKCGVKGALREGPVGVAGGGGPFRAEKM